MHNQIRHKSYVGYNDNKTRQGQAQKNRKLSMIIHTFE